VDPVEPLRDHMTFYIEYMSASPARGSPREWGAGTLEAIARFQALTQGEALAAGHILLDVYDQCLRTERDGRLKSPISTVPLTCLRYLGTFQPAAMRELYPGVIERELFLKSEMYGAADAATRDALLARLSLKESLPGQVDSTLETGYLLDCLASIGDEVVVAKFAEWRAVSLVGAQLSYRLRAIRR
jgi:hypothetical protein